MSVEAVASPSGYNCLLGDLEDSDDRENFGLRVGELLYGSDMHQYIGLFRDNNIGMDLFLSLNENDLAILGVSSDDIPKLSKLIRSLAPKRIQGDLQDKHLQAEPEPPMRMKDVLLMQCYTAKQLKNINKMLEIIEHKLKQDKFENTLLDTDYCAARALKILCSELVRQADILCAESKNLNEVLCKVSPSPNIKKKRHHHRLLLWIGILASITPIAVVLWRSLRK